MVNFKGLAHRMRGSGQATAAPDSRRALCEYVDAGGGLALVRVAASEIESVDGVELVVSGAGAVRRFDGVPEVGSKLNGATPIAFAGPIEMLTSADLRLSVRSRDGIEYELPAPVDRTPEPSQELSAEDAAERIAQLTRRCEVAERALRDARASAESQSLVKAWRECNELRELIDVREAEHSKAKREALALSARTATLDRKMKLAEQQLQGLEGAAAERDRLAAELRSHVTAQSRARKALARANDDHAALASELAEVKQRLAGVEKAREHAACERDRARAAFASSKKKLAEANARAAAAEDRRGEAERSAGERELLIERFDVRLERERRATAFARLALRDAKRRELRLRDELACLDAQMTARVTDAEQTRPQAERRAYDDDARRASELPRPAAALRQLLVSVAASTEAIAAARDSNGHAETPALIDRFALGAQRARRRFGR